MCFAFVLPYVCGVFPVFPPVHVDEAHVQGSFPSSSQFLQSAHDEEYVDCRARWAKAALLLWEYPPCLAVVAEAGRDNFQQHFA